MVLEKGKPAVRRGRKVTDLSEGVAAGPPEGDSTETIIFLWCRAAARTFWHRNKRERQGP